MRSSNTALHVIHIFHSPMLEIVFNNPSVDIIKDVLEKEGTLSSILGTEYDDTETHHFQWRQNCSGSITISFERVPVDFSKVSGLLKSYIKADTARCASLNGAGILDHNIGLWGNNIAINDIESGDIDSTNAIRLLLDRNGKSDKSLKMRGNGGLVNNLIAQLNIDLNTLLEGNYCLQEIWKRDGRLTWMSWK